MILVLICRVPRKTVCRLMTLRHKVMSIIERTRNIASKYIAIHAGLFKQQALPLEGNKYKYAKETLNGAPLRQFKFFNGMIIGAAPQMDINGVTKV